MRIIVTGSRHYDRYDRVLYTLLPYHTGTHTLVHGAAPGLDTLAARAAEELKWEVEAHPADWGVVGPAAGPARNQLMVNLGADLCIAFPLKGSKGTWDCVKRAHEAGISVRVIPL